MELTDLFKPVEVRPWSVPGILPGERICDWVFQLHELSGDEWMGVDIAILGIDEGVNSPGNHGCALGPSFMRKYLYGLKETSRQLKILDLGNLLGGTLKDKYFALQEAIGILSQAEIPVLVLGGSHEFTLPLAKGVASVNNFPVVSIIDSLVNLSADSNDFSSHNFLDHLVNDPVLTNMRLYYLGQQKYLMGQRHHDFVRDHCFQSLRLGELRGEMLREAEPVLRDSDLVSFDASAIQYASMPAQMYPMPNGFSSFEACQLSWYTGMSDNNKIFSIFEINPEMDGSNTGIFLGAQMAWHYLEGLCFRHKDYPLRDIESYTIFHVAMDDLPEGIRFFNNAENKRWWVELPLNEGKRIVACSESDYQLVKNNELPEKWWTLFAKSTCNSG
jgi:arginase family enzyme